MTSTGGNHSKVKKIPVLIHIKKQKMVLFVRVEVEGDEWRVIVVPPWRVTVTAARRRLSVAISTPGRNFWFSLKLPFKVKTSIENL